MKTKKITYIKKLSIAFSLSLFLFLSPVSTQKTYAFWGEFPQEIFHYVLQEAYDMIRGVIIGAAKQAAVKMLNSQVDSLLSGNGSDSAAFITDWKDYLVTQPENNTRIYMNSYLAQMTSGRGSSTGYSSEGFSGGGDYATSLIQTEKSKIANINVIPTMTYEGDPDKMLEGGNFKSMSLYFSGVNNPVAFHIAAQDAYQKELDDEKAVLQARSVAYQGFKGTSSSGNPDSITYPGILTKEMAANVENIPNNVIASAKDIPEVITSIVSKMITKKIQEGFSGIENSLQKENSSQDRMDSSINNAISTDGPGVLYKN